MMGLKAEARCCRQLEVSDMNTSRLDHHEPFSERTTFVSMTVAF